MTHSNVRQCIDRVLRLQKTAMFIFAAALVSVLTLLPAVSARAATPQVQGLKAAPTAPKDSDNGVNAPIASKNQLKSADGVAPLAWSVGLTASSTNLWPKQYSTLTATASADVGPTPYYTSIYDATAGSYIKICGSGTVCSISVTYPTATTHTYRAYISSYPTTNPPLNQQAVSASVTVRWRGVSVSLQASPTTLGVNGTSILTATASADIGPSPFYIQIYNATTGTHLKSCGFGTTCSVGTSKAFATTQRFVAYVSSYGTAYPPTGVQATSNPSYVTWTNGAYRVSLASAYVSPFQRTLTATSNINVGPTPYFIEIFNLNTGARIAVCGTGTTCSVTVSSGFSRVHYAAFISSASTTLPPLNTQASSNIVTIGSIIIGPNSEE